MPVKEEIPHCVVKNYSWIILWKTFPPWNTQNFKNFVEEQLLRFNQYDDDWEDSGLEVEAIIVQRVMDQIKSVNSSVFKKLTKRKFTTFGQLLAFVRYSRIEGEGNLFFPQ